MTIGRQGHSLGELVARWAKLTDQNCSIRVAGQKCGSPSELHVREARLSENARELEVRCCSCSPGEGWPHSGEEGSPKRVCEKPPRASIAISHKRGNSSRLSKGFWLE
ncbi:hypothetical protein DEO72_LG5g2884 [Vigna unguiculata]|uniref:Uncharacterized protein n=1 Tax=Vigna unguiculata TaxID=3917 RepID=A0A4D6M3N7_VIGUN|nr:hypothetical protein DEO72_LG5g2884 [Vigna unguiculata]